MSKRSLFLIRHAKSSWKNSELLDRQRPLNKRGHRNANDMSAHLSSRETEPDLILSSPAKRALHTAQYFANEFHYPSFDIQIDERLYFCGVKGWLSVIKQLPSDVYSALLFGHNPEISQGVSWLTGKELEPLPTCAVVKLEIKLQDWSDIESEQCGLKFVWSPKDSSSLNHSSEIDCAESKKTDAKTVISAI